jgi:cytidine deaminase
VCAAEDARQKHTLHNKTLHTTTRSAVGLAGSGAVYVGVNLEFPGMPLNASVHAEQCLVANLLLHGEASLRALAVSAAPCGHCRQFYSELQDAVRGAHCRVFKTVYLT